jgi:hypothetical protein
MKARTLKNAISFQRSSFSSHSSTLHHKMVGKQEKKILLSKSSKEKHLYIMGKIASPIMGKSCFSIF